MEYLISKVINWAHERNLIDEGSPKTQMLKCVSEVGELADDVNKSKDIRDSVGDVLVTLIILTAHYDIELEECLKFAYDEIKDRKGVLLDGVFIKETDPAYQGALAVLGARRIHKGENNGAGK